MKDSEVLSRAAELDLTKMKAVAEAATPGPWVPEKGGRGAWIKGATGEWAALSCADTDDQADANATFIATFDPPTVIALLARIEALEGGWQPIETAPRDGAYIKAVVTGAVGRWEHLNGRYFAIRHEGRTSSGFDMGWSVFPGFGGVDDSWFSSWRPLPDPPAALLGDRPTSGEEVGR